MQQVGAEAENALIRSEFQQKTGLLVLILRWDHYAAPLNHSILVGGGLLNQLIIIHVFDLAPQGGKPLSERRMSSTFALGKVRS